MTRFFGSILILAFALPSAAQHNAPCIDQPKSLGELKASFHRGRLPLASQLTGRWVQIGVVSEFPANRYQTTPQPTIFRRLNCSGERRGDKFEFVLVADGYSAELHVIGTYVQKVTMQKDHKGSVTFPVDYEADEGPDTYRCRLTHRNTLACVSGPFAGVEFKKMAVRPEQICDSCEER